jgi:phospholipid/cholesterol/gamma-HCH transport system substrate-binding protein
MSLVAVKFGVFGAVMVLLTIFLFAIFGQYETGSTSSYSAMFSDVSGLQPGASVRVAGVRVGTVKDVSMNNDKTVAVAFDADRHIVLTTGTRAEVRYLNLVGDRYLELSDGPGATTILPSGATIPVARTAPALNLDLLLGGLKPVIRGLNPADVNALSSALIEALQGQQDGVESLFSKTSSFSNTIADHSAAVQHLVDNLRELLATVSNDAPNLSAAIDRLEQLVTGLAADRDPIGDAIDALDKGTASVSDLLTQARAPLANTVDELNRLAPALDAKKDQIDTIFGKLPEDYRKLARVGSYGSFVNYFICSLKVRVSDRQGRTVVFPVVYQEGGRCAEPK